MSDVTLPSIEYLLAEKDRLDKEIKRLREELAKEPKNRSFLIRCYDWWWPPTKLSQSNI